MEGNLFADVAAALLLHFQDRFPVQVVVAPHLCWEGRHSCAFGRLRAAPRARLRVQAGAVAVYDADPLSVRNWRWHGQVEFEDPQFLGRLEALLAGAVNKASGGNS